MIYETEDQKRTIGRWCRLAIQLNGAADSGDYDDVTTAVVIREIQAGSIFDFLVQKLPADVWAISKLTDVDRHSLAKEWKLMADGYEPAQFHVRRSGLALLVAYLLHQIGIRHAIIPK
jgi:hypothetical protein